MYDRILNNTIENYQLLIDNSNYHKQLNDLLKKKSEHLLSFILFSQL